VEMLPDNCVVDLLQSSSSVKMKSKNERRMSKASASASASNTQYNKSGNNFSRFVRRLEIRTTQRVFPNDSYEKMIF